MIKKILFFFAILVVFMGGILISALSHIGSPLVAVHFVNKSGKEIKTIDVIHETGRFGEIQHRISNLSAGKERQIRIWAPAESSYKLLVTFADQKQLAGGEGYIEPGYKMTEIIENDKIKSEVTFYGAYGP